MRTLLVVTFATLVLGLLASYAAGSYITMAQPRSIGDAPADLGAQSVRIPYGDGQQMAAWLVPGQPGAGVLLLVHGVRADRRVLLDRARLFKREGLGLLLIDLPAHGESTGGAITFGARESAGVAAALAYLPAQFPQEKLGVLGISLGGASYLLSDQKQPVHAVVLESVFATVEEATRNRLRAYLGPLGPALLPLLTLQLPLRLGINLQDLRPIDHIGQITAPLLVLGGTADRYTPPEETQRLFEAAHARPKYLWLIDGAAHVDLHAFAPFAYEAKVLPFLKAHLRSP